MIPPRVFVLVFQSKPDTDPIRGIRHILKLALRRYGMRCIDLREIGEKGASQPLCQVDDARTKAD